MRKKGSDGLDSKRVFNKKVNGVKSMNKKAFLSLVVGASVIFSQSSYAADSSVDDSGAMVAGGIAGGVAVAGIGASAATLSGAGIMSGLAVAGAGSAAVGIGVVAAIPLAIGASAYGLWYWLVSDDED